MCFKYTVYGLTLQANHSLPNLISASDNASVDIWVELNGKSQQSSTDVDNLSSGINIKSKSDGTYFHLWFHGDGKIDFEIDATGCHISASWVILTIEEVTTLLLGQVLGCALRLRGTLCLHACVLKVGEQAIAIVGESGAGKSTTAAALSKRGHAILSDDIAVLSEVDQYWFVQPGYPRLRLWPQSIQALYGSEDNLSRILSFSEKRFINLNDSETTEWQFHNKPLPLAAIYILGKRQLNLATPMIEAVPSKNAVLALMKHRTLNHLPLDKEKQAQEFAAISRVVVDVPVRKVNRRDSLDALPQICDAILEDLRNFLAVDKD